MNKAYVEQIRNGLSTTALSMDTQWAMMHNHKLNDQQRLSSEACYQGLMQTLCFMAATGYATSTASTASSLPVCPAGKMTSTPAKNKNRAHPPSVVGALIFL